MSLPPPSAINPPAASASTTAITTTASTANNRARSTSTTFAPLPCGPRQLRSTSATTVASVASMTSVGSSIIRDPTPYPPKERRRRDGRCQHSDEEEKGRGVFASMRRKVAGCVRRRFAGMAISRTRAAGESDGKKVAGGGDGDGDGDGDGSSARRRVPIMPPMADSWAAVDTGYERGRMLGSVCTVTTVSTGASTSTIASAGGGGSGSGSELRGLGIRFGSVASGRGRQGSDLPSSWSLMRERGRGCPRVSSADQADDEAGLCPAARKREGEGREGEVLDDEEEEEAEGMYIRVTKETTVQEEDDWNRGSVGRSRYRFSID